MNYITVEEFKTEYPEADVSNFTDATLSGMITKASRRVDDFVEFSFELETITDELEEGLIDEDRGVVVFPRKNPIVSLTSLDIVRGTITININLYSGSTPIYNIPTTNDRIWVPTGEITLNSVSLLDLRSLRRRKFFTKISYTAGYATIPERVKDATALYLLDQLSRRNNLAGASSVSQGGISISYRNRKGKTDFVLDAENILASYQKVTGF